MTHPFVSRKYTNKLLEMVAEGLIDKDFVIMACVRWMSEDDVREMMAAEEISIDQLAEEDI